MTGTPWAKWGDVEIFKAYAAGSSLRDVAVTIGRSKNSVIGRAQRLGLGMKHEKASRAIKARCFDRALQMRKSGFKITKIAKRLGISVVTVSRYCNEK